MTLIFLFLNKTTISIMDLSPAQRLALEIFSPKQDDMIKKDDLSRFHPETIKSLSKLNVNDLRKPVCENNLIVRGNSSNSIVNKYIIMDAYGKLFAMKSCYIIFPPCRTDAIGIRQDVYPQRIFFAGPASEIPVDHGVFRMISPIEIYESPEFSSVYNVMDDAVELID